MRWGKGPQRPVEHDHDTGSSPRARGVRLPLSAIIAFVLFDAILVAAVVAYFLLR